MWIEEKYSDEVQGLIDFYNNQIEEIANEYKIKMDSATAIVWYAQYGGIERARREFEERIKPYQDRILDIILHSTNTMIIHDVDADKFMAEWNKDIQTLQK